MRPNTITVAALAVVCISTSTLAATCPGGAEYELRVDYDWVEDTVANEDDFPRGTGFDGPHFSTFVFASHAKDYTMWKTGQLASEGVKEIAEEGDVEPLENELDDAGDDVLNIAYIDALFSGTGTQETTIDVDYEHRYISGISMIAPSPDWFIGVSSSNLCDHTSGKWRDSVVRSLFAYDAGTDSGPKFLSDNEETIPPRNVFRLSADNPDEEDSSFFGSDPKPFAKLTMTLKD